MLFTNCFLVSAPTKVITAAHCVYQVQKVQVCLGAHDLRLQQEQNRVCIDTYEFEYHAQYNPNTLVNDIAMITLPRAVEQSKTIRTNGNNSLNLSNHYSSISDRYIRPIRLARYDPQPRDAVTISGWGQRHDNDREKFPLQEVTVDVMDNRNCNQYFNNVNGGMICTSGQFYTGACRVRHFMNWFQKNEI